MIKLRFSNPIVYLNGKETIMTMLCSIVYNNKTVLHCKKFNSKITLKNNDKYDLNKARLILQTTIEKEAYKWAYNKVSMIEKSMYKKYTDADSFCRKATHVIEHDKEYLEALISN